MIKPNFIQKYYQKTPKEAPSPQNDDVTETVWDLLKILKS